MGLGTDGDATAIDDMTKYRAAIAGEVEQRKKAGIGASGESSQVVPLVPDLMGPAQFQKLARHACSSAAIPQTSSRKYWVLTF